MKSADGTGLAFVNFAPCVVSTILDNGVNVTIHVKTQYPFEEKFEISVLASKAFIFSFRIPTWAPSTQLVVNGKQNIIKGKSGTMYSVSLPAMVSKMSLQFETHFRVVPGIRNSISLHRGSLVFALQMQEKWTQLNHYMFNSSDWQVLPLSPWNYGVMIANFSNPDSSIDLHVSSISQYPFAEWAPPIYAKIQAKLIPEWQVLNNAADYPPFSPVFSNQTVETITLIPFGCAKLRISSFPWLKN